ncbi:alpha/beta hydrolase [Streptomyces sp. NPDC017254]|uniref:alpha/beta hydrolase n=1 Tax=unclassified Streptomyces TaxID=2593676 RepID=UPI0037B4EC0E
MIRSEPDAPTGAVLLLHGGRADGLRAPPVLNLPALRLRPFGTAVLSALPEESVLLAEVRYRHRGWNGARADAVRDTRAALAGLRAHLGDVPVVLLGHSMGGRAALRAAGDPGVRGVVALAPWCPPGEPVGHLRDRRIYLLHDERDRVTSADDSWSFVRRAREAGADAVGIPMRTGGHSMLRGAQVWQELAARLVAGLLTRD